MPEPETKIYAVLQENYETGENEIVKAFVKEQDAVKYLPVLMNELLDTYREANPDMEFDFQEYGNYLEAEDMFKVSVSPVFLA